MTYRALELLNLPLDEPAFLLDIGCGSGLSGEILDEEGYIWAGVDIAPSMLGTCLSGGQSDCTLNFSFRGRIRAGSRRRSIFTRHRAGIRFPARKF